MTSIKLVITGVTAQAEVDGILTSGMTGIPVTIEYDSVWDGLTKNLVCRNGTQFSGGSGEVRTIPNIENEGTVAHEVMVAGRDLFLGVEGRNADGTLVIPTLWAECGRIEPGANADADPSADPTLPIYAQLEARIENLEKSGGGSQSAGCTFRDALAGEVFVPDEETVSEDTPIPVTGVALNKSSVTLSAGDSETLIAAITPDNASNSSISWKSSDTAVARVATDGTVTAVSAGTAVITATSADTTYGTVSASCSATCENVAVTGITLSGTAASIEQNTTTTLTASITPDNATNKNVIWSSSDNEIATVAGGVVTGVSAGDVVITAKTEDGGFEASFTLSVTDVSTSVDIDIPTSNLMGYYDMRNALTADNYITDLSGSGRDILFYPDNGYYENGYMYRGDKVSSWINPGADSDITDGATGKYSYSGKLTAFITVSGITGTVKIPLLCLGDGTSTQIITFSGGVIVYNSSAFNNVASSTAHPTDGNPFVVAVTIEEGGDECIYLNGFLKATSTAKTGKYGSMFRILAGYGGETAGIGTKVHNTAIYNDVLGEKDIAAISGTLLTNAGGTV